MADPADRAAQDLEQYEAAMRTHYDLPPGEPGYCRECDEHSARLVKGLCATCRDLIERAARKR